MKRRALVVLLCSVSVVLGCSAQNEEPLCKSEGAISVFNSTGALQYFGARFVAGRGSSGEIELTNSTGTSIENLFVLVAFVDGSGRELLSMPFVAKVGRTEKPSYSFDRSLHQETLKGPIGPGERVTLKGSSPISTFVCPIQGIVTYTSVVTVGGNRREYQRAGWRVQTLPTAIPSQIVIPARFQDSAEGLLVRLCIDAKGNVGILAESTAQDSVLIAWLEGEFRRWTFQPELVDGSPTKVELQLLVRIQSKQNSSPLRSVKSKAIEGPFVLLDMLASDSSPGNWGVVFGDRAILTESERTIRPGGPQKSLTTWRGKW